MRATGKIKWKGEIKTFKKGFGLAFKLDTFDSYLSLYGHTVQDLVHKFPFNVGDDITVDYEQNENFFNVKSIWRNAVPSHGSSIEGESKLDRIEAKLDKIIDLLEPINDNESSD